MPASPTIGANSVGCLWVAKGNSDVSTMCMCGPLCLPVLSICTVCRHWLLRTNVLSLQKKKTFLKAIPSV